MTKCKCGNAKTKSSKLCGFCYRIAIFNTPIKKYEYKSKTNAASRWSRVRENARKVAQRCGFKEKACHNCGYDKHVEICHIKDISQFDENEKIGVVNNPNNLV